MWGLLLSLLCADTGIVQAVLGIEGVIGCAFDKVAPFHDDQSTPEQAIHRGNILVMTNELDKPTCRGRDLVESNVQSYSRELPAIFRESAGEHSLLNLH